MPQVILGLLADAEKINPREVVVPLDRAPVTPETRRGFGHALGRARLAPWVSRAASLRRSGRRRPLGRPVWGDEDARLPICDEREALRRWSRWVNSLVQLVAQPFDRTT
jgi:hypothetical protein